MLDHVSIGVPDIAKARQFYDAVLGALGYHRLYEGDGYAGYGDLHPQFWINTVSSPVAPNPHSGLHFSFRAATRKAVDAFYTAGLAHGGSDNGKPGLRPDYGATYYAAFVVDPNGYRIEAHTEEHAS